ncbi:MAG: c-type cytochrome [Acidimicrobiia bacterium]
MFKRIVVVVEILALAAAAGFVIALFVYDPGGGGGGEGEATEGSEIFAASCAGCHGADGGGGTGPQLSDGAVVAAYPDPADEAVVVNDGRGAMPGFQYELTPEQIAAVVEYTRTL